MLHISGDNLQQDSVKHLEFLRMAGIHLPDFESLEHDEDSLDNMLVDGDTCTVDRKTLKARVAKTLIISLSSDIELRRYRNNCTVLTCILTRYFACAINKRVLLFLVWQQKCTCNPCISPIMDTIGTNFGCNVNNISVRCPLPFVSAHISCKVVLHALSNLFSLISE